MTSTMNKALAALQTLTGNKNARFHPDQQEAIEMLVNDKKRVIVVQRTGWGKSAVYFIATHLLRQEGFGPTLIISPLIALMNNQIDAAARLGLRAYTINSSNDLRVGELSGLIQQNAVDVLLISPERLANPEFMKDVMPKLGRGLIVIDEVHCISDWGHDFRPDYRRLGQVIRQLPPGIPVLGTTATANDTVIADVSAQLGDDLPIIRGPLRRDGLCLSTLELPDRASRLAWLNTNLSTYPGTGIIYCLTQRDVDQVAEFLTSKGHKVARYRSGNGIEDDEKARALNLLIGNKVKAVVASTALGMGYDKPDVGFVIHYQSTDSLVGYYQQVGRAGRALQQSHGVMMRGSEDSEIHSYFVKGSFPHPETVDAILEAFKTENGPLSVKVLEKTVNLSQTSIESTLKQLHVEGIVERKAAKTYERTAKPWSYPHTRVKQVTESKRRDAELVRDYFGARGCRMRFIVNYLNDPDTSECGICDICTGRRLSADFTAADIADAQQFLRRGYIQIAPRRKGGDQRNIPPEELLSEGWCLSAWRDGGYGDLVRTGKQTDGHFADELVDAMVAMINDRRPTPKPAWVTCVPSTKSGHLVPDLAQRVADRLRIPFLDVVKKTRKTSAQKTMQNSSFQARNVNGAFTLHSRLGTGPVLLIDDLVDSRWTFTEVGRLLRRAGCPAVYPMALASTRSGDA